MSRNWYILNTYTGYEKKIQTTIKTLVEKGEIDTNVLLDDFIALETIEEIKDGKKKQKVENFMPGYLFVELDLPEIGWNATCEKLFRIKGVSGFVGCVSRSDRPVPTSFEQMKPILERVGKIKGSSGLSKTSRAVFEVGDSVKISDGSFAGFTGTIKEVHSEKEKYSVEVQIFGRPTPVDVSFLQVEKV